MADNGTAILELNMEAEKHAPRLLERIHEGGMKAGVVLTPGTQISACEENLEDCDLVLLMSVNPGFGGQHFIPATVEKISRLRTIISAKQLPCQIEVDGGINPQTAKRCIDAGATILVAGSAVFGANDPKTMIQSLRCK